MKLATRSVRCALAALLMPAAAAVAQSYTYVPAGQLWLHGPHDVRLQQPFGYASSRFQYVDGTQRGVPLTGLDRLDFQRDERGGSLSVARRVQLDLVLAHAAYDQLGTSFANNYADTPVVVLSRAVDLPETTNDPRHISFGHISLPFSQPFDYDGARDLLIEFRVASNTDPTEYVMDAVDGAAAGLGECQFLEPSFGCPTARGSFDLWFARPTVSPASVLRLAFTFEGGPPSSPLAIFFGVRTPGIYLGCGPWYVGSPAVAVLLSSDANGRVGGGAGPVVIDVAGMGPGWFPVTTQGLSIQDLGFGAEPVLSNAVELSVRPPASQLRYCAIFAPSLAASSGTRSDQFLPVMRLQRP